LDILNIIQRETKIDIEIMIFFYRD